jgi:hypothetical protein
MVVAKDGGGVAQRFRQPMHGQVGGYGESDGGVT